MVLSTVLATRWTIRGLGVTGFGTLTTLIAVVFLLRPIGSALTYAAFRHIAVGLHRHGADEARQVFSAFWWVSAALTLAAVFGSLVLPDELIWRLADGSAGSSATVASAFRFLVVTHAVTLLISAPFKGVLTAREAFSHLALLEAGTAVMYAVAAWLTTVTVDPSVQSFATYYLVGVALVTAPTVVAAAVRFSESRPLLSLPMRDLVGWNRISAWHLLGELTEWARTQFSLILMNVQFGASLAAAFAVGVRVDEGQDRIGRPVLDAIKPQIIRTAVGKDEEALWDVLSLTCRVSTLISLAVLLPVVLETERILTIWLGEVPRGAVLFAQLGIMSRTAQFLSLGHLHVMAARDRLGPVTLIRTLPQLFVVAVLAVAYSTIDGLSSLVLPIVLAGAMAVQFGWVIPAYVGRVTGLGIRRFLARVTIPMIAVATVAAGAGYGVQIVMGPPSLLRVATVGLTTTVALAFGAWAWLFSAEERRRLRLRWIVRSLPRESE